MKSELIPEMCKYISKGKDFSIYADEIDIYLQYDNGEVCHEAISEIKSNPDYFLFTPYLNSGIAKLF